MFATRLPVENAHVICETQVSSGVQGAVENVEDRPGSGGGMLWWWNGGKEGGKERGSMVRPGRRTMGNRTGGKKVAASCS